MSLIASIREFVATYDGLQEDAGLFTDVLAPLPTQYALISLPGQTVITTYLNGKTQRQYSFALQSTESTADDPARVANLEFYEAFADWLEEQSAAGTLPNLDSGKTAEHIEAVSQPILFELGDSGTGIYQLQCRLVYEQEAS